MPSEFPVGTVVDAHVHLMPDRLMRAIRQSLAEEAGWAFAHPTALSEMATVLTDAGVDRFVALPYAHRPGIATDLNDWVCEQAATATMDVLPFCTVHAGDDDVGDIVADAVDAGACGLKFQFPVQGFPPDDPRLDPAYEHAADRSIPVVMHAGTAPMFGDDSNVGIDRFRSFLASYPDVRVCVAHMGTYDTTAFLALARENETVYLDTTFAMSSVADQYMDFDPSSVPDAVLEELSTSIMYGSDFPNIPYPYLREREHLLGRDLSREAQRDIFAGTAERFIGEA